MTNTLYLPEIREMLANNDKAGLEEFCTALHPGRTTEFMEGLTADEIWRVLQHTDAVNRAEIFRYFDEEKQVELIESQDRDEIAQLIGDLKPDDRVDLLEDVDSAAVDQLLPLVPDEERRDILRLRAYPEDTAGAVMTTEFARLSETLNADEALREIGRQAENLETIYYLYIVDDEDHLRGLVSARQLVSAIGRSDQTVGDMMERDLVTADVFEDQEEVAAKVARYNLLAIPVVDAEHRMLGMVTHDDIIDVVREEATEDAHRIAAVDPLEDGYLQTSLWTLTWKRGIWLTVLFFAALLTAVALEQYESIRDALPWLAIFIPLVISSGGNTGSQSATLIITALSTGDVHLRDWSQIVLREAMMGLFLGGFLAAIGYVMASIMLGDSRLAAVVPITLVLVVLCGTLTGSILPLLFKRMGLDPAIMSNPFVAGIIDIVGIVIYMNVALWLL